LLAVMMCASIGMTISPEGATNSTSASSDSAARDRITSSLSISARGEPLTSMRMNSLRACASRAKWNKAGTSRDDHRALTLGPHREVSCLPCHRRSWNRCGSRSLRSCPALRSTTRWAATAPASPTGWCSTSSSRSWGSAVAIGASPTTPAQPRPAPPPGRVDQRRRGRAAPPGGAGRLRPHAWPTAGAPGRGRVHHQGTLRRPDRRAKPDRPPQAGAETIAGHRGGRHPVGGGARPGQPSQATGWGRPRWTP
jgi:hypothetical protein